ncbi:MAG TPA: hypothetical protein VK669_01720, partial [Candidatus Limnocylindrales bacterium]|nr:hypothetical protein [Candidatus Limnocylindrales bacterium]
MRLYDLTNGKVARIAQFQVRAILQKFDSISDPQIAETVLDYLTTVLVLTFGRELGEALNGEVFGGDAANMATFLTNLGAVDDEKSEDVRRGVLETYRKNENHIIAEGAEDGLDVLDQWRERHARRRL